MDAFAKARQKHEKKLERKLRAVEKVEIPEQKAVPVVQREPKRAGPMVLTVSGPVEMVFEIDYAGTLLSSQMAPQTITELFKKHLSAFGRVRCQ